MKPHVYEIGDKIYYANSEAIIGTVVGVREVYWSDCDKRDITYTVFTERGRVRNVCASDVKSP